MAAGLFEGEGTGFAAAGAVGLPFLFRGGEFVFYAGDGVVQPCLCQFAFPYGDDGPGFDLFSSNFRRLP